MIRIKGRAEKIKSNPVHSILITLKRNSIPIETVCGGKAQCGRCLIRVAKGLKTMNARNDREISRLKALGAASNMRLACQSYTHGDIEIEIINPGR